MSAFEPTLRHIDQKHISPAALWDLMRAILERGAKFRMFAGGFSMEPFIRDGDIITVSPISAQSMTVGDVVVFNKDGAVLMHRILWKREGYVKVKGDNNPFSDGWIKSVDIVGKIIKIERRHGIVRPAVVFVRLYIVFISWLMTKGIRRHSLYKPVFLCGVRY